MNRNILLLIAIITCAGTAGFGQSPTPLPAQKANQRPADVPAGEPFDKATVAEMASKCVTLDTEIGAIVIELFPENAPETVRNFLNLAATQLYDTTTFSRVVRGFVIQGGSIWTRSGGVPKGPMSERARRRLVDEPNKILHERGILSMARGDEPNSASTSFFILVDAAPHLDGKFAAFGRVVAGMDVVDAVNKAAVTDEKPDKPVRLNRATVAACARTAAGLGMREQNFVSIR